MLHQSPLHVPFESLHATFAEDQGWQMPAVFTTVSQEYDTLRSGAAMIDLSHRSKVLLTGADRASFLHNFCTNEIVKQPVGGGCEAFLTTAQAKILAWIQVSVEAEAIRFHAEPGLNDKIIPFLDRFLIAEQVAFVDRTEKEAMLFLTGPKVHETLVGMGELQNRHNNTMLVGAVSVQVERNDMFSQQGYFLSMNSENAAAVWGELLSRNATPVGLAAYETLRVEAGVPAYGKDIDETNLPQEIDRTEEAISFTKGCYLGQETVARLRAYGHVNRLLRKLVLAKPTEEKLIGAKVLGQGKEIGQITSTVFSPQLQTTLALGYVRRGQNDVGTKLEIETPGGNLAVTVHSVRSN